MPVPPSASRCSSVSPGLSDPSRSWSASQARGRVSNRVPTCARTSLPNIAAAIAASTVSRRIAAASARRRRDACPGRSGRRACAAGSRPEPRRKRAAEHYGCATRTGRGRRPRGQSAWGAESARRPNRFRRPHAAPRVATRARRQWPAPVRSRERAPGGEVQPARAALSAADGGRPSRCAARPPSAPRLRTAPPIRRRSCGPPARRRSSGCPPGRRG